MNKLILILLIFTGYLQAQTLQNPTYGKTTTNTLVVKTPATITSVNFLPAYDIDGITVSKIAPINVTIPYTPINYTISTQSIGSHLSGIDTRLGQISSTTAGITQRVYFTADNTTVTAGTFFTSSLTGKGSTATGSPPALVLADNTKGYFTKDIISVAFPSATIGYAGSYTGQLTVSASPTPVATQQRFTVEIYRTNNGGTPIASGVSGAPTGDLGVTVVAILDSGILNLTAGSITNIPVTGILTQNITLNTGERLRYHVSAAKIGTGGGNVTFGVYYGTSYNSYYDIPVAITTDAVLNKSSITGVTATDALNNLYNGLDFPNTAYVTTSGNNATAQLGNMKRPFLTIDSALDALPSTGGVVKIGIGTFNSPNPAKIKSNTAFIGSKKPITNSVTTITGNTTRPTNTVPTKLINGTILNGTFDFSLKDNITIENLGVDTGSLWCTTFNGGVGADALITAQIYNLSGGLPSEDGKHQLQTNQRPTENIYVNNVIALGLNASNPGHAMLFENVKNSKFTNLTTYYNSHGVVIKGIGVELDKLDAHSHETNGLITKSNDYAYCQQVNISNVYINSLSGYEGGGVRLVSQNGTTLRDINFNNINVEYTKFLFNVESPNADRINISGANSYDVSENAFYAYATGLNMNVDNVNINKTTGDAFTLTSLSASDHKKISNINIRNSTGKGFYLEASGSGRISVDNISSYGNTGNSFQVVGNVVGTNVFYDGTVVGNIGIENKATSLVSGVHTLLIGSGDQTVSSLTADANFQNGWKWKSIGATGDYRLFRRQFSTDSDVLNFARADGKATFANTVIASPAVLDAELATFGQVKSISRPYKVYTAFLTQSGTSAPVANVFENTLGGTIVWTRDSTGIYSGTLANAFTANKTACFITNGSSYSGTPGAPPGIAATSTLNVVKVSTISSSGMADSATGGMFLEVRVYP